MPLLLEVWDPLAMWVQANGTNLSPSRSIWFLFYDKLKKEELVRGAKLSTEEEETESGPGSSTVWRDCHCERWPTWRFVYNLTLSVCLFITFYFLL